MGLAIFGTGESSAEALAVRPQLVAAALLAAFVVSAVVQAFTKDIAVGFDELAHVSFVAQIQACGCVPSLTELRLLDPATMRFTIEPSYINHPSIYYQLMALGPDITAALPAFRLVNAAMIGAALLLMFATVFADGSEPLHRIAGIVLVGTVPVMAQLGGSVNNDNLAILAGAITVYGAVRFSASRSVASLLMICAGLILAGMAKLTGLMLCGAFVAALMLQIRPTPKHLVIVAVAALLAALPYVFLTLAYGSPAPDTPGQAKMLADGAHLAGWDHQARLAPIPYLIDFARQMLWGWLPRLGGRTVLQEAALLLPLSVSVLGIVGCWSDPVTRAGTVAIILTLAVHVLFSYQRHLETGWLLDAYPRYYLPMLGILPLAVASALRSSPRWMAWFVVAAPVTFAVIG